MRKIYSGRSGGTHSGSFEFIVNTAIAGSSGVNSFRLPFAVAANMSFLAEWGDGTSTYIDNTNYTSTRLHNYGAAANYTVKLSGNVKGFSFGEMNASLDDAAKLIEIVHWGDYEGTEKSVFRDCDNFTHVSAKDTPLFVNDDTCFGMFFRCVSLVAINNLENWNTHIIGGSGGFNQMFAFCDVFESGTHPTLTPPNLTKWDTTNCDDFRFMFWEATVFNGELFRVTKVLNSGIGMQGLENMFNRARAFNNNGSPSIQNWDVSSAGSFVGTFLDAEAFNQPLDNWDVSNVTTMNSMFLLGNVGSNVFNQPLSSWDTSNVTDMRKMFYRNQAFDQDISSWNVNSWNTGGALGNKNITSSDGLNLSTANYDALLIAWDAYSFPSWTGSGLDFGTSTYSLGTAAETARTSLIAKLGSINDGGGV